MFGICFIFFYLTSHFYKKSKFFYRYTFVQTIINFNLQTVRRKIEYIFLQLNYTFFVLTFNYWYKKLVNSRYIAFSGNVFSIVISVL